MSDLKMREEYEAWYAASWDGVGGPPKTSFEKDSRGQYKDTYVHEFWVVWQASRAAVVIELPSKINVTDRIGWSRTHALTHNNAMQVCQEAIEAAGLKVKQ